VPGSASNGASVVTVQMPPSARSEDSATAVRGSWPEVPGYEILGELGRGGMGVVYQARQWGLNRVVALKMILAGVQASDHQRERFRSEAQAVARLRHPNIVQIYEVGELDGQPFFSLEYVEGGSLAAQLGGTPWPPTQAAALVETLAGAVHHAHEHGIIHRDLKPANVLLQIADLRFKIADLNALKSAILNLKSAIKITDFGLAKRLDVEVGQTASGAIVGTPSYMAPEQTGRHAQPVGPATDVYALGAILYELLTGRPPFRAATHLDTIFQVVRDEPVPPSRLHPRLPRDLETICLKCLEKDPRKRYASAQGLGEDLGRFIAGEPIQARPVSVAERALKWARRRPVVAALGAALVLAALGVLALVVWHNLDLQQRIDQALTAEHVARQYAERATRAVAVARGQAALAQEAPDDWQQAASQLAAAVDRTEPDAGDADAIEARQMLDRLRARLAEHQERQAALRRAQEKRAEFLRLRDQALLHATLSIGDNLPANREATGTNARLALARFGIAADGDGPPALDPVLTPAEKEQILDSCYLLLVVWADAEAQPGADRKESERHRSTEAALTLLRRAEGLKIPTRACHQRRARYLRQLARETDAREEDRRAQQTTPTRAVDYYLLGDEHYQRDDLDGAVRDFENVLRLKPDDFWARYYLSVCYVRLVRFTEAQAFLTDCITQQPGFVWLYLMRGFASGQRDQFDPAEEDFAHAEQLLRDRPDDEARYALHMNRGVLRARRPGADAVGDLQQALAVRPRRYEAYLALAQICQGRKEWDTALAYYRRGVEADPSCALLYRNRAQLYVERQDLEAALRDYDCAIGVAGPRADVQDLARDHVQRGRILNQRGRYEEAVQAFTAAAKAWPEYTRTYLYRAEVLLRLERYEDAIGSLEEYEKKGGKARVEVYQARARALTRLHRHAEAVQAYSLALAQRPKDSALYAARGWEQLASHALEPALRDFERATVLDPKNADAFNGCGQARATLGRYQEAVADAEQALRLGPETASLLADAARTYALAVGQVDAERSRLPPLAPRSQIDAARRLRLEYVDRAVKLLRAALDGLKSDPQRAEFWRERVLRDPALEPIRTNAGFARLAAQYAGLAH
jgi:tetratricopeptide (TPR) repeat protein